MENKNESKKLLTHFTVTTALMGALFMGADLVQTSSGTDDPSSDISADRLYDNVATVADSVDPAKKTVITAGKTWKESIEVPAGQTAGSVSFDELNFIKKNIVFLAIKDSFFYIFIAYLGISQFINVNTI